MLDDTRAWVIEFAQFPSLALSQASILGAPLREEQKPSRHISARERVLLGRKQKQKVYHRQFQTFRRETSHKRPGEAIGCID